ncbi:hypothetical protein EN875_034060 [Mesorhizobium sp. M2D.F.Ca.ET.232.01.1.1]|uniref:hypothetical protein n=1 Tax=Mesorhizobium sp. M2D.F.Ca.ET.232.01.1.1 TaxID=2496670 RepID=UPI000FCAF996|nr:hypothetical protein [Mesorhizobium sp. M2D.F.Ca.ET.232.01.1.1]TGP27367.1 hypothetical protein EN875_034060 [Mesorhizobium sp. M2D.F.Ca.ET.232.01.1.1]
MVTRVEIKSQQQFNGAGNVGALMFLAGPLLSAYGYYRVLSADSYVDTTGFWILFWLGAMAAQVGIVFMLVGRKYDHQVTVHPANQASSKLGERPEWN